MSSSSKKLRAPYTSSAGLDARAKATAEARNVVTRSLSAAGSFVVVVQPGSATLPISSSGAIIAGVCDGSLGAEWNARPNCVDSRFKERPGPRRSVMTAALAVLAACWDWGRIILNVRVAGGRAASRLVSPAFALPATGTRIRPLATKLPVVSWLFAQAALP